MIDAGKNFADSSRKPNEINNHKSSINNESTIKDQQSKMSVKPSAAAERA
jgi:hypothetical protein